MSTIRFSDGRRITGEMNVTYPGAFGSETLAIFLAMFGGSTFLLFLLCYCCQKKLREDSLSLDDGEISNDRSHLHQIHVISGSAVTQQAYQALPPSPPPAYDTVIKKDPYVFEQSPPPYEIAMANLRSGGFV